MAEEDRNQEFTREDLLVAVISFGKEIFGLNWVDNEHKEEHYSDVAKLISGPYFDTEIGIVVFVHPEIKEKEGEVLADEVFYIWKKGEETLKEIYRIKNPTFKSFDNRRRIPIFQKRVLVVKIGNGYLVYRDLSGNKQMLNF